MDEITEEWVAMTAAAERFGIPVRRLMAATDGCRLHWRPVQGWQLGAAGPEHRMVNLKEVTAYAAGEMRDAFEPETE